MSHLNPTGVGLSNVVDVADREDLFEILGNERVLELSHLGPGTGFRNEAAIIKSTGVQQRRMLRFGVDSLDVALAVAAKLQFEHGFDWNECPAIGLCHSHTNPRASQQLAYELCDELDIDPARLFTLNFGCTGYIELLRLGAQMLQDAPVGTTIPLLTVETPEEWHDGADRAFCGIISTGATGCVMTNGAGHTLHHVSMQHRPIPEVNRNFEPLFYTEAGEYPQFCGGYSQRCVMRMNGEGVFLNGVELMIEAARTAISQVVGTNRRVLVAPHQPSGKMLRALFSVLKEECPGAVLLNNLALYANSISSTIPTVLAHIDEILAGQGEPSVQPGDLIIVPAAGICMENRATHLSQGWAVIEW
jgi:3-oxoacyl-[acyl-carrier-protein] synthase III